MTRVALRTSVLCLLTYLALTVLVTWPLTLGLARDVPGDLGDSLLNMWILGWVADGIPRLLSGSLGWEAFWSGNIFHPEPYTLALSEHLFAQALQIAPVYAFTGNLILCYNLLFLSTFVLSAFGAFLLVRDLTGDWRAGMIAGLVYGFLPYRVSQIAHIQILTSQWMPFVLWGLHRYIAHGSRRALVGGTAALVLQNWSSGYFLLYFAPFVPIFAVQQLGAAGRLRDRRAWLALVASGVVTFLLTLPFLLPYLEVQRLFAFERSIGEVATYSANVWSYVTASDLVRVWGQVLRFHPASEGSTFLGAAASLLALVAVVAAVVTAVRATAHAPRPRHRARQVAAAVLLAGFVAQTLGLAATLLVGGFRLDVGGIVIRATTPVRLLVQSVVALVLLLAVSPRARAVASRIVRSPVTFYLALMLLAMWLSLGPDPYAGPQRLSGLGLYAVLYDYVPGFTGLRVPARYAMIAGLFLAVLAGYGAAIIGRRRWGAAALCLAGVLVVADGAAMPMQVNRTWGEREATPPARVFTGTDVPRVYQRLAGLPDAVVAEFPFGDPAWEIRYVYYAASHHRPILNGYSGAYPPGYKRRAAALARRAFDPDGAWRTLVSAGVTHVVMHVPAFANANEPRELMAWLESHGAHLVESFSEGDALYALPPSR